MKQLLNYIANRPVLILTAGVVIYLALGFGQDGINLDSTTYSVIARNMVEDGRWFNPTYTPYYHPSFAEHPPLVMWAQALIFGLFGAGDSTARLFGALCTLGSILAVFYLGREIKNSTFGFVAGLLLLLTYNFIQIGNSTLLDVPLSFFVLMTLFGIARLQNDDHRWRIYVLTGVSLGLAFLTKGVVSGPVWIALGATALLWKRSWLKSGRFWAIPGIAIGLVGTHILLDQLFAGGHFTRHYFMVQVWSRFFGGGPEIHTDWWEFSWRFVKLYAPWVILLPFGIYAAISNRMRKLYPLMITLLFYFLFYSTAAKLYYHYFCPVYALAAPLTALPLVAALPMASRRCDRMVSAVRRWFLPVWIVLAVVVLAADVRIHELRSPEIYNLRDSMQSLLKDHSGRQGLFVRPGEPDWDYVAKTSWYWRSDIKQVDTIERAMAMLSDSDRFAYVMLPKSAQLSDAGVQQLGLRRYVDNDRLVVYIPVR